MKNKISSNPDSAVCCFCGKSLKFSNAVELSIKPNLDFREIHTFYSHKACLDNVIDDSIPVHPDIRD